MQVFIESDPKEGLRDKHISCSTISYRNLLKLAFACDCDGDICYDDYFYIDVHWKELVLLARSMIMIKNSSWIWEFLEL